MDMFFTQQTREGRRTETGSTWRFRELVVQCILEKYMHTRLDFHTRLLCSLLLVSLSLCLVCVIVSDWARARLLVELKAIPSSSVFVFWEKTCAYKVFGFPRTLMMFFVAC